MADTVCDHVVAILTEWGVDTVFRATRGRHQRVCRSTAQSQGPHSLYPLPARGSGRAGGLRLCQIHRPARGRVLDRGSRGSAPAQRAIRCEDRRRPVLAITGMTYHDLIGTHYLQDINQDYLFQNVAAYNQRIMAPEHVENVVNLACRNALAHRAVGHVAIPIDIQAMAATDWKRFKRNVKGHTSHAFQTPRSSRSGRLLEEAAKLLAGKEKIAILAGAGARGARSDSSRSPSGSAPRSSRRCSARNAYPTTAPTRRRDRGGRDPAVGRGLPQLRRAADCRQRVSLHRVSAPSRARPSACRSTTSRSGSASDTRSSSASSATRRRHCASCSRYCRATRTADFLTQAQEAMREWWALLEERASHNETPMRPQTVAWHLPELMAPDAILCGDSGTVTVWQARMKLRDRQRFSFSGTMCSMAAALPYAIGAQVAYPNRQVVAFTGDGSLTMMMGDFVTLVQHKLPVKVVVMKNNTLGLIKWEQMLYLGNPEYGVDLAPVDFVKFAEACGARGLRIEDPKHCREQLRQGLAMDGPVLIECVVDPLEPPWPPEITRDEAEKLVAAMRRGERNTRPIGLTIGRHAAQEFTFSSEPVRHRRDG